MNCLLNVSEEKLEYRIILYIVWISKKLKTELIEFDICLRKFNRNKFANVHIYDWSYAYAWVHVNLWLNSGVKIRPLLNANIRTNPEITLA